MVKGGVKTPPAKWLRLLDVVEQFPNTRLLVIGDLMLDHFVWGDVERISPEAPVPVARQKLRQLLKERQL